MLMALSLAAPSAASAATITLDERVLRLTAAAGTRSNVMITESGGTVTLRREAGDTDAFPLGGPCSATATVATCPGPITRIEIDVRDLGDRITATSGEPPVGVPIDMTIAGGDGPDALTGGVRNDTIDGGAGDDEIDGSAGNDVLRGGDGNDVLLPNTGTDSISGGDGIDTASFGRRTAPTFALDALANDGDAGENDLIGSDVENVEGSAFGTGIVTMVGDSRSNRLTVVEGRADLTGGDGVDVLQGGPLDDMFRARDGVPDTILCNGGTDTVEADMQDVVSTTCENVSVQSTPGGALDDRAPTLAWAAPGAAASLSANDATTLRVDASDDRGLAKVQFLDDDRVVCEDLAAPYECAYTPRGGDVGRNTLVAIAVDTAGQTSSVVRAVTVRRFTSPGLSLSLRPGRDRTAPYSFRATGTLRRPTTVSPTHGCSGRVAITAKRGTKTVSTTLTSLTRTCEYAVTVRFRSKVSSRVRLVAKFEGNDVMSSRSAPSRTARLG